MQRVKIKEKNINSGDDCIRCKVIPTVLFDPTGQ